MSTAALASRLNPKNNTIGPKVDQSNFESISAHDIAGALGMARVTQGASILIRLKWARHENLASDMVSILYRSLGDVSNFDRWVKLPTHRPGLILDLCRLAIIEFCQSPQCKTCLGTKHRQQIINGEPTGKIENCPTCGGYGTKPPSRQELVFEHLKLKPREFNRGWNHLYRLAFDILGEFEREGQSGIDLK